MKFIQSCNTLGFHKDVLISALKVTTVLLKGGGSHIAKSASNAISATLPLLSSTDDGILGMAIDTACRAIILADQVFEALSHPRHSLNHCEGIIGSCIGVSDH